MTSLPLILRADDFGATPGSNDGILAALQSGQVLNVGIMAVGPHLEYRLDELRAQGDRICLGLHAALTSEWKTFRWGPVLPADQVPSLVLEDQCFPPSTRELHEQASLEEMMAEIRAQLQTLRDRNLDPRYLDSHMNFTWIEGLDGALRDFCKQENLVYAHDPKFQRFNLPLTGETFPDLEDFEQALPKAGPAYWIFHPALPDNTGALPPDVADNRRMEAEFLAKPPPPLQTLLQQIVNPVRYDQI